jgi:hypothetical protein
MAHHFKQGIEDVIFGYRLNKIKRDFEEFLLKLTEAGAELIFVFKKTQVENLEDFAKCKDLHYQIALDVIHQMRSMSEFERLKNHFERKIKNEKFELQVNDAVPLVLNQVAQRYGKMHGMDTIRNRVSTFQIHLANQNNALAIIGLNTHYTFFEGNWAFWSDADLDMSRMTIRQYDRKIILRHLGITTQQAPLFTALAGGLYSSDDVKKKVAKYFRPWEKNLFRNVSIFVNQQSFPLSDCDLESIICKILGSCYPHVLNDFKETIRLMDPHENKSVKSKVGDKVMEIIKDEFANYAEEILEQSAIFISPVNLDLR